MENTSSASKSRRVILSDKAYFTATDIEKERIKTLLRYVIPASHKNALPETVINYQFYPKNVVSVPISRLGECILGEYVIDDRRVATPAEFPEFRFTLREQQQLIVDDVSGSCMVNANPSFGKSFTGLAIAAKLSVKTLVVVHTTMLRDQWVQEVEKVFGFTPSIYGGRNKESDGPITIGNIQSLVKMPKDLLDTFGCLILDECHHSSANTFTDILQKSKALYKLGLSGTLWRKDSKHILFKDYFSDKIYEPPEENMITPTVYRVKTKFRLPDEKDFAAKVTALSMDEDYIDYVTRLALVQANKGHQVLVIADRVEFLTRIAENCSEAAELFVGGSSTEFRDSVKEKLLRREKHILVGSRQIMSEGISINTLSCLILASPINNRALLKQVVARVIRIHDEEKLSPIVFDLMLQDGMGRNQAKNRHELYVEWGYPTREINESQSLS